MVRAHRVETIPIFPLEHVVLFPCGRVPLHIFEPRYRQMTANALAGDRRVGMVAVVPDHVDEMAADPPVFSVGCLGIIEQERRHRDGRYDLVLRGTQRFRIVEEPPRKGDRLYRCARVTLLEERPDDSRQARLYALRMQVIGLLGRLVRHLAPASSPPLDARRFTGIEDETFVNVLCQLLDLPPTEKQGLLEADGLAERCERLVAALHFRLAELDAGLDRAEPARH